MTYPDWATLRTHAIQLFGEPPHPATEQDIIDAYQQHPDAIAKAVDRIAHDVASGTARSGWGVLRAQANTIQHAPSNPTRATGVTREKTIARAEQWIRNAGCHYDRQTEVQDELFGDRGPLREYAHYDRSDDADTERHMGSHRMVAALRSQPDDRGTDIRRPLGDPETDPQYRDQRGTPDQAGRGPDRRGYDLEGTPNPQAVIGDTQLADRMLEAWRTARPAGERVEQELDARGQRWIAHQAKLRELAAAKAAELEQAAAQAVTAPAPDHTHEEVPF